MKRVYYFVFSNSKHLNFTGSCYSPFNSYFLEQAHIPDTAIHSVMNGSLILLQQNICSIDTCWSTCITTFDIKMYFWTWTSIECQSIKGRPPCIVGFDLLVFHDKLPDCRSNCSQIFFKIVFLKIPQYSQENTCAEVFFYKVAGLQASKFIKKRLLHRCFPVNIEKIFKNSFFHRIPPMTASVAAGSRIWILVYFPWKCVAALVALFKVVCFAILSQYSAVYLHWLPLFLVVLALYALSILSFVTAPKLDSSDDEADFKFWNNIYFYNQRINK